MPKIREIASIPVYCVRDHDDVSHARQEMLARDVDKLGVLDEDENLVGILTVRDLVEGAATLGEEAKSRLRMREGPVRDVMTRNPFTVQANRDAASLVDDFVTRDVVAAPVLDDRELVGIVTAHDLLPALGDRLEGRLMVRDAMTPDVVRLPRHATLAHAARVLGKERTDAGIVADGASDVTRVGVITLESLLYHVALEQRKPRAKEIRSVRTPEQGGRASARKVDFEEAVVEDAMWTEHPTVRVTAGAHQAANVLFEERVDALPVTAEDDESIVGMLTKRTLLKAAREVLRAEA